MKDTDSISNKRNNVALWGGIIGGLLVIAIFVIGTIGTGRAAHDDTGNAVHSVSSFYLDELAGRREQVVAFNLQKEIEDLQVAVGLLTEEDLSDASHLQAFQARMKSLYRLEKFAFVDTDGIIYTSMGTQDNISDYSFDYNSIAGPEISVLNIGSVDRELRSAALIHRSFHSVILVYKDLGAAKEQIAGSAVRPCSDRTADHVDPAFAVKRGAFGGVLVYHLCDKLSALHIHVEYVCINTERIAVAFDIYVKRTGAF